MVPARNTQDLRIIPLLVAVCFLSFPAQAQYGGGTGEPNDPYLIYTAEQMNAIGANQDDWNKHFKLMVDIDLSEFTGTDLNIIGYYVAWNDNIPFTGVFDGNGYDISNFTYTSADTSYIGLFVYVEGQNAQIKDLRLTNPNVDAGAGHDVGALVGYLRDGTITGCSVESGSVSGGSNIGGLVGTHGELGVWPPFTISNCCSTSSVHGTRRVGGLVGYNDGTITNCYATGSVTGTTDVGGLVGQNGSVLGVVNDKPVDGPGMIYDCYSTASVFATGSSSGGLVGRNYAGEITNCYATGSVEGPDNVGGLLGNNDGEVRVSFWNIETSGRSNMCGTEVPGGSGCDDANGKTTAEMQTAGTFLEADWDFVDETANGTDDIWWILEGQDYPRLWWELTEANFIVVDDFESYGDLDHWPEKPRIFNVWIDGYGIATNGSIVGYEIPPFCEQTIVHGGRQSMPYFYDNTGTALYSEAQRTFRPVQDWTIEGVGVLSLWFHGKASNAAKRMYVALNSSAIVYYENPNALLIEDWTEWRIDLQEFTNQGVDLTNVELISIGFGDKNNPQPGGSGLVFFDDIRLYRPAPESEPTP